MEHAARSTRRGSGSDLVYDCCIVRAPIRQVAKRLVCVHHVLGVAPGAGLHAARHGRDTVSARRAQARAQVSNAERPTRTRQTRDRGSPRGTATCFGRRAAGAHRVPKQRRGRRRRMRRGCSGSVHRGRHSGERGRWNHCMSGLASRDQGHSPRATPPRHSPTIHRVRRSTGACARAVPLVRPPATYIQYAWSGAPRPGPSRLLLLGSVMASSCPSGGDLPLAAI